MSPVDSDAGAGLYDALTREVRRWQTMNEARRLHDSTFTLPVDQPGNVRCRICRKELTAVDVVTNDPCPGASHEAAA